MIDYAVKRWDYYESDTVYYGGALLSDGKDDSVHVTYRCSRNCDSFYVSSESGLPPLGELHLMRPQSSDSSTFLFSNELDTVVQRNLGVFEPNTALYRSVHSLHKKVSLCHRDKEDVRTAYSLNGQIRA